MIIVEYNESWPEQFISLKNILENNLSKIIRIEHIGSTSIIGMCAKPLIDIVIIIMDNFVITKYELDTIGYYHNGDQGIPGREVFKRANNIYDDTLDTIHHHLYVCDKNNKELKKFIHFRNYLNENERTKLEYRRIKKEIINETWKLMEIVKNSKK